MDSTSIKQPLELEKIKASFEEWDQTLSGIEFLSLEESLRLMKACSISIPRVLTPDISYPMTLYRARIISPDSKEDIGNPKTFSYPPKEFVQTYQRANVPGHPVFYGAADGKTALEELRKNGSEHIEKGDKVYLAKWKIKENAKYTFNNLTVSEITGEGQMFSGITKRIESELERIFEKEDPIFKREQIYLFKKISELFLTGNYLQSGVIAYKILFNTPEINGYKIDGILYPSCSNNFRSFNCALRPDFVDKNLELVEVRKLSFEEFTDEGVNSTSHYLGTVTKGEIIWKKYVSTLLTKNVEYILYSLEPWNDQDADTATFYVNNEELNFNQYCQDQVEEIDLIDFKIAQKDEKTYRENRDMICLKSINFEQGVCYFKTGNTTTHISNITIKIPVKARSETVTNDIVLNQ
jgi:hypothetical protein